MAFGRAGRRFGSRNRAPGTTVPWLSVRSLRNGRRRPTWHPSPGALWQSRLAHDRETISFCRKSTLPQREVSAFSPGRNSLETPRGFPSNGAPTSRNSSNSLNGSFFWHNPSRVYLSSERKRNRSSARPQGRLTGPRLRKPQSGGRHYPKRRPGDGNREKADLLRRSSIVLRSDCQQISAQPSERNASWMSARLS